MRGPAHASPLSQSAGLLSSQQSSLQPGAPPHPSAVAPLGIVAPTQRACSCRHGESRSCQRAAQPLPEPPSLQAPRRSRDRGAGAPFSFPGLQVLPSPSSFSKRPRQEQKAQALGSVQVSANSTVSSAATPPNMLQVRGEERPLTAGTSGQQQAAPAAPERERLSA